MAMVMMVAVFVLCLTQPSDAAMQCTEGYHPRYINSLGGWGVSCCFVGLYTNETKCLSEKWVYGGSCASMFNLTNPFACDCGSLCTGKVFVDNLQITRCENCTCPESAGCDVTFPPVYPATAGPRPPSSSAPSSHYTSGVLFVVVSCLSILFFF